MAKIVIKGHATRGKEVIEILKMLGGNNAQGYVGTDKGRYYFINYYGYIDWCHEATQESRAISFTLEQFLEKYPYKVGDKVKIIDYEHSLEVVGLRWSKDVIEYEVHTNDYGYWFKVDELQPYKEQESMEEQKLIPPYMDYDVRTYKMNPAEMDGERFIVPIPKGYEFAGIDDNKQHVVFEKVKPQYPKTYGECCRVLELTNLELPTASGYGAIEIEALQQLLICRNAYWKLYGEQTELGKPWEPDWSTEDEIKYVIEVYRNNVRTNSQGYSNTILAFPTEEMRDAFYENFKELIEECKELL